MRKERKQETTTVHVRYRLEGGSGINSVIELRFEAREVNLVKDKYPGRMEFEGTLRELETDGSITISLKISGSPGARWRLSVDLILLKKVPATDEQGEGWINTGQTAPLTKTPWKERIGNIAPGTYEWRIKKFSFQKSARWFFDPATRRWIKSGGARKSQDNFTPANNTFYLVVKSYQRLPEGLEERIRACIAACRDIQDVGLSMKQQSPLPAGYSWGIRGQTIWITDTNGQELAYIMQPPLRYPR